MTAQSAEVIEQTPQPSLQDTVAQTLKKYLQTVEGEPVNDLYDMVIAEVEAPMLKVLLDHTRHNQTKVSTMLGINRGTLRKKMKQHHLL